MTAERYDYYQSQQQKNMAVHRTPITATKMASETENHAKDGPCHVIALPNLPSVGGRVKYAMGAMTANQFSQRCGVSANYLNQLCTGKAKTLSAYNANRIAGASAMNVTVGWLLGLQQNAAPEPHAPTKQESQELPDLPDFWARLEWAVKNSGKTRNAISFEIGANTDYVSYSIRNRSAISSKYVSPLAKALGVSEEWLFKDSGLETSKYQRDYVNSIIEKVKNEMELKSLSYEKMAEQIMCSQSSIYKWMHGQGVPKDESVEKIERYFKHCEVPMMEKAKNNDCKQNACNAPFGTHLHFEGVYSGDVLSALVSVLKGTYRVNLTIDEVGAET